MRRSSGTRQRFGLLLAGMATAAAACSTPTSTSAPSTPTPATTAATPSPSAVPPAPCAGAWGSEQKAVPGLGRAPLVTVRTSSGPCADRVEFELDGPAAGYSVGYVDEVVQDGSGAPVTVPGGARLQVQLNHPAYSDAGQATYSARIGEPLASVSGYRSLLSVVFAGSFEGYSTFGVGVRARLPFRVSVVDGPEARSRLVVEVAHAWS